MRADSGLHCPECAVEEPPCPMPWRRAGRYGVGHAAAIADQAVRGIHRTFPVWLAVAMAGFTVARVGPRERTRMLCVVGTAVGSQVAWIVGYAAFAGARTAVRLTRPDRQQLIPVRIWCPAGGPEVLACAHHAPLRDSHYVDSVFAWPRGGGGGSEILRRLVALSDDQRLALTLTALSPRTAGAYRRAGFRQVVWIYWMRRDPQPERGASFRASLPADAPQRDEAPWA